MSSVKGYNIQNVGTSRYVDLKESNPAPGTPVIAWTLDNQTTGALNQQWRLFPSHAGDNRHLIQAANPPSFAYVGNDAAQNTQVIGHNMRTDWEVTPREDGNYHTGAYTIRVPKTKLVWTATTDNKIVLQNYDPNNKSQQFTLKLIN
ncbi:hypothetical protein L218DRAFT_1006827 [Marasmius fiardii PR-910]|nr:hypothetical protein L218DRAFT_1006827 [Marasmius fiardii PR-910]